MNQTKLSRAQYQTLLDRTMSRRPVEQQVSSFQDLQGIMAPGADPQSEGLMQGPPPQAPPVSPMLNPRQQLGMPEEPQMEIPTPPMSSSGGLQDAISQAEQAWMKLKDGMGGQLWARLAMTAKDTMGKRPDAAFVESMIKFQRDPESIKDDRIKEFLVSIVGVPQQPTSLLSLTPQLAEQMAAQRGGMNGGLA
jgi:hypothetical protein